MHDFGSVTVEEHVHGGMLWVAVRARGAEWSWLTRDDALRLAQHWITTYGSLANPTLTEIQRQLVYAA